MKRKFITVAAIFMFVLMLGCGEIRDEYSSEDDIRVEHQAETDILGRITVSDTYKKEGVNYYVVTTDIDCRENTYSQDEYESLFGLGNDAFDTDIYTLTMKTNLAFCDTALKTDIEKKCEDGIYYCDDFNEDICNQVKVWVNPNVVRVSYVITRYSYLGESDFTEEEIERYREQMNDMCLDFLSILHGGKHSLSWRGESERLYLQQKNE